MQNMSVTTARYEQAPTAVRFPLSLRRLVFCGNPHRPEPRFAIIECVRRTPDEAKALLQLLDEECVALVAGPWDSPRRRRSTDASCNAVRRL